jgi:hypothetical protein
VALVSVERVDGRDAYKLKLTHKNGDVQHVWGERVRRVAVATMAVGLVAGFPVGGRGWAAEPSAAEVVAKNVAARGGLDAWRKVETMVWIGHIESAHAPLPSMPFELGQKRPNKMRLEMIALGDRSMRVFDGAHGWKLRVERGQPEVQPFTPQELKYAAAGHGIDGPLIDLAAGGDAVTLKGVDELGGGRKAYHLEVRSEKGGTEDVWVDTETFLDVRYDRMAEGPAGAQRRVSATYGDYRTVDGLKIPFLVETGGGPGATPDRMRIERVLLNVPLDDANFGNPLAPHPRGWAKTARRGPAPTTPSPAPSAAPVPPAAPSEERGAAPR